MDPGLDFDAPFVELRGQAYFPWYRFSVYPLIRTEWEGRVEKLLLFCGKSLRCMPFVHILFMLNMLFTEKTSISNDNFYKLIVVCAPIPMRISNDVVENSLDNYDITLRPRYSQYPFYISIRFLISVFRRKAQQQPKKKREEKKRDESEFSYVTCL